MKVECMPTVMQETRAELIEKGVAKVRCVGS